MIEAAAVKSLRFRYVIGLSVIAILISTSFMAMKNIIAKQENYSHVIFIAGQQSGLANRIAHFVGQLALIEDEDEFLTARAQLGRAINKMAGAHEMLLTGNEEEGVPKIMTPLLKIIYHDSTVGLDPSIRRFLNHAQNIYDLSYEDVTRNHPSYVYVINYGPHVLEPMLESAVSEYEAFSRSEIRRIVYLETLLWMAALSVLLLEALFIFRPLEGKVRESLSRLEIQAEEMQHTIDKMEITRRDMERQKDIAEKANRAKSDFLSNMSHELRTPLNAIIGFTSALQAGVYGEVRDQRQDECLSDINASGNHLLSLINDILDISAAQAERMTLAKVPIDLPSMAEEVKRLLEPAADRAGLALRVEYPINLPDVLGDVRRIRQVLFNLISNAIKFTPEGGHVRLCLREMSSGDVEMIVEDSGVGMTAQELKTALDRFGQVGSHMTRDHSGTGLGLPLAANLVRLHEAEFRITSTPGVGTRIQIIFPKTVLSVNKKSGHDVGTRQTLVEPADPLTAAE